MTIHSCSYYCNRPECIKAQRDELVKRIKPSREWVGLTDEEIETIWKKYKTEFFAIKEVEAKLKEKNT